MIESIYKQLLKGEGRISGPVSYVRKGNLVVAMYDNQVDCHVSRHKLAFIIVNEKSTGKFLWIEGTSVKLGTRNEFWAWVDSIGGK